MTLISIIGATGATGSALRHQLHAEGVPIRPASRNPRADEVRFDWHDPTTHEALLTGATALYVIPPLATLDPMPVMAPFLDLARKAELPRLVLLGSLAVLADAPGLAELAATVREHPGWTVLRPSGFMQNFTGAHPLATRLRERGELLSASGAGRLGWIDAEDIAAAARAVLLAPEVADEYVLTGPEALSYPDTARILREETGRMVDVVDLTVAELAEHFRTAGMPADFADRLARYNGAIRDGCEDAVTDVVARLTGRTPRSFAEFVSSGGGRAT